MTLRSSCLGLRAKIFVKKVSKQSRLSFKVGQGVPHFTHVQNRTTLAEVALRKQEKGDAAEVASVRHVQKCTSLAEVAIQTHKKGTWQKLPQSKNVQKCTIWQKCPRIAEEV